MAVEGPSNESSAFEVFLPDNGGAINMSGLYYPALETLAEIVEILGLAEPAPR